MYAMNKKTIYQMIVDQSGSMTGSESQVIEGFNGQLKSTQTIQKEFLDQDLVMGLRFFNSQVDQNAVPFRNVNSISSLNREVYRPDGGTALLDAIGKSIYDIKTQFGHEIEENLATVVLIIITDGYENSSRFYTYGDIQRMVKELEATGKWNFTFMGADLDALEVSQNMGFNKESYLSFSKEKYAEVNNEYFDAAARHYAENKKSGESAKGFFSIFSKKDLR
jgi:hypothetical protein